MRTRNPRQDSRDTQVLVMEPGFEHRSVWLQSFQKFFRSWPRSQDKVRWALSVNKWPGVSVVNQSVFPTFHGQISGGPLHSRRKRILVAAGFIPCASTFLALPKPFALGIPTKATPSPAMFLRNDAPSFEFLASLPLCTQTLASVIPALSASRIKPERSFANLRVTDPTAEARQHSAPTIKGRGFWQLPCALHFGWMWPVWILYQFMNHPSLLETWSSVLVSDMPSFSNLCQLERIWLKSLIKQVLL